LVLHELKAVLLSFGALLCKELQRRHGNANRMASTDRILGVGKVVDELVMLPRFDCIYCEVVQLFDALVDRRVCRGCRPARERRDLLDIAIRRVRGIAEARTPMAEIRAHDEGVLWVFQVRRQQLSKLLLFRAIVVADHDGDYGGVFGFGGEGLRDSLVDVGQVHLERVLVHVTIGLDVCELARVPQGSCHGLVDGQVAEWGGVLGELGEGAAVHVVGMRGAEDEDALGFAEVEALICPGGAGPRVRVSCMSLAARVSIYYLLRAPGRLSRCNDDFRARDGESTAVDGAGNIGQVSVELTGQDARVPVIPAEGMARLPSPFLRHICSAQLEEGRLL
jgi:hypothetical protein